MKSLNSLPKGLDEMYNKTLERIARQRPDDVKYAHRALSWVCLAARPLDLQELRHAVSIERGQAVVQQGSDFLIKTETMLSICGGLLMCDANGRVRFIHYTAGGFVRTNQQTILPQAVSLMAHASLAYVEEIVNYRNNLSDDDGALSRYIKQYTPYQIRNYHPKDDTDDGFSTRVANLDNSKNFEILAKVLDFSLRQFPKVRGDICWVLETTDWPQGHNLLKVAVSFNCQQFVMERVPTGSFMDNLAKGDPRRKMALHDLVYLAAFYGHEDLLKHLLQFVDKQSAEPWSPNFLLVAQWDSKSEYDFPFYVHLTKAHVVYHGAHRARGTRQTVVQCMIIQGNISALRIILDWMLSNGSIDNLRADRSKKNILTMAYELNRASHMDRTEIILMLKTDYTFKGSDNDDSWGTDDSWVTDIAEIHGPYNYNS